MPVRAFKAVIGAFDKGGDESRIFAELLSPVAADAEIVLVSLMCLLRGT